MLDANILPIFEAIEKDIYNQMLKNRDTLIQKIQELGIIIDMDKLNELIAELLHIDEGTSNKLIDLDAKFLLFAPVKCLERTNFNSKLNMVPESLRKEILERKLDETEDYVSKYIVCELESAEKTQTVANMVNEMNDSCEKSKQILIDATTNLGNSLYEFIVSSIKEQLTFNIDTSVCYCIGSGENYKFLLENALVKNRITKADLHISE